MEALAVGAGGRSVGQSYDERWRAPSSEVAEREGTLRSEGGGQRVASFDGEQAQVVEDSGRSRREVRFEQRRPSFAIISIFENLENHEIEAVPLGGSGVRGDSFGLGGRLG